METLIASQPDQPSTGQLHLPSVGQQGERPELEHDRSRDRRMEEESRASSRMEDESYAASRVEGQDPALGDPQLLSMDVEKLYPSLNIEMTAKIIYSMVLESPIQFDNINYDEVGKYLAVMMTDEEIDRDKLKTALPVRNVKLIKEREGQPVRGARPGISYLDSEVATVIMDGKRVKVPKWKLAHRPSARQQKRMVARLISTALVVAFQNHLYMFDGKVYLQLDGGPIGLELAQAAARMVRLKWDELFLN